MLFFKKFNIKEFNIKEFNIKEFNLIKIKRQASQCGPSSKVDSSPLSFSRNGFTAVLLVLLAFGFGIFTLIMWQSDTIDQKADEQGDAEVQFSIGLRYYKGESVEKDDVKAAEWFRKAAEQGLAESQNKLGLVYYRGEGVPQDDVEAVKWFRRAAEQGNARAQHSLGLMYAEGQGVPEDDAKAVKWYRKAAEQGLAEAQHSLGLMYSEGEGVPQDDVEGYAWYLLWAKTDGDDFSNTMISFLEKDLTTEQKVKGQVRSLDLHRLYGAK